MRGSAELNVVVLVRGKVLKYSYGFATLRDLGSAADPSSS
jgi:hypothetical protein